MARITSALMEAVQGAGGEGNFLIVDLTSKKPVYDGDGQLLKFVDGKDAARYSATLATKTGLKYQPRRINDDKWVERERARFADGSYQELPWAKDRWWTGLSHIHDLHFPHVSTKNSIGLMAYTESAEKGTADVQTPIKPGRYLEQFFAGVISGSVIRDLCARFSEKFEENVVLFGHTEDEFQEIYTKGPSSCMAHALESYSSHIHPVRVYAAGDLAVAYLKREGRIVARCLTWPEKKQFNTIYGDTGRLDPLLRKMGYSQGVPTGARMLKVFTHQDKVKMKGPKALVVPHVDGGGYFEDAGDHLILLTSNSGHKGKKVYKSAGANGISEWLGFKCDGCEKDDFTATQMVKVVAHASDNSKLDCYCPGCAERDAVKCPSSGYHVLKKHTVTMWDGAMWWAHAFKGKGFVCESTHLNYPISERVQVRGKQFMSKDYLKKQGGKVCSICSQALLNVNDCDTACKRTNMMKGR